MARIFWEYQNAYSTAKGHGVRRFDGHSHKFVDVTDRPAPTIATFPPPAYLIVPEPEDEAMAKVLVEVRKKNFARRFVDLTDEPAPTLRCDGLTFTTEPGEGAPPDPGKPPYRVPPMAEIAALEPNGLKVASTFAGCGGSSLGYRMAGFRILWANEFVPIAAEAYRANMAPGTILDTTDIRQVTAGRILERCGIEVGELDVLDGSPPCQAFSTSGQREKGWGRIRRYDHGAGQKNEELFFEYIRLLEGLRPKVFVAENVSGLVKGASKGFFLEILAGLKACGYRVEARLLDAQWLGVPQRRQRVIFVGVRDDLGRAPAFPKPLPYRYLLRDALPWIVKAKFDPMGQYRTADFSDGPCMTITANSPDQFFVEAETDISRYAIGREWDRIGYGNRGDSRKGPLYSMERPSLDEPSPTVNTFFGNPSVASVCHPTEKRKFSVAELRRLCGFPDDFILPGSFAQQCERLGNAVPPVMMSHVAATVRDRILLA